jgi:hypothetical protein
MRTAGVFNGSCTSGSFALFPVNELNSTLKLRITSSCSRVRFINYHSINFSGKHRSSNEAILVATAPLVPARNQLWCKDPAVCIAKSISGAGSLRSLLASINLGATSDIGEDSSSLREYCPCCLWALDKHAHSRSRVLYYPGTCPNSTEGNKLPLRPDQSLTDTSPFRQ